MGRLSWQLFGVASGIEVYPHALVPHRHREIEVNFLEGESIVYLIGGHRYRLPAGCIAVFWAAVPHHVVEFSGNCTLHWLTIPVGRVLSWSLPPALPARILQGAFMVGQPLSADVFRQWHEDLRLTREHQDIVLMEVEAALRRLSLRLPRAGERHTSGGAGSGPERDVRRVESLTQYIANNYATRLTVDDIAGHVGIHAHYAAGLCRRILGVSIVEYVTHYRVAQAQRLLVTTDHPPIEVMEECGFGSMSQFYAAFTRQCGMPPQQYRATLGEG